MEDVVTPSTDRAAETEGEAAALAPACRSCGAALSRAFADLGSTPLANSYLTAAQLGEPELFYPLSALVCEECLLVQVPAVVSPAAIFDDYAYFSSFSDTLLRHAREYADQTIDLLSLGPSSTVVEIASNDGYLLRNFAERGIPVLGIEPARNVAAAAEEVGIPTRVEYFTSDLAERMDRAGEHADLVVANNVLAHVPDLNGFVAGLERILAPEGVVTVEFPHVLRLIERTEFDTIYHEHLSYFSLLSVERPFLAAGLELFDVEEIPAHGGSLRIWASRPDEAPVTPGGRIEALREDEHRAGLDRAETYSSFESRVRSAKQRLLEFLIDARKDGKSVVGYGAAAKATTLLNYCGIRGDFVDYVVDRSPHKQGRFLPGTHLPIRPPEAIAVTKPDYLLLFAWNLADEIVEQMSDARAFGCRFVVPIPEPIVFD